MRIMIKDLEEIIGINLTGILFYPICEVICQLTF